MTSVQLRKLILTTIDLDNNFTLSKLAKMFHENGETKIKVNISGEDYGLFFSEAKYVASPKILAANVAMTVHNVLCSLVIRYIPNRTQYLSKIASRKKYTDSFVMMQEIINRNLTINRENKFKSNDEAASKIVVNRGTTIYQFINPNHVDLQRLVLTYTWDEIKLSVLLRISNLSEHEKIEDEFISSLKKNNYEFKNDYHELKQEFDEDIFVKSNKTKEQIDYMFRYFEKVDALEKKYVGIINKGSDTYRTLQTKTFKPDSFLDINVLVTIPYFSGEKDPVSIENENMYIETDLNPDSDVPSGDFAYNMFTGFEVKRYSTEEKKEFFDDLKVSIDNPIYSKRFIYHLRFLCGYPILPALNIDDDSTLDEKLQVAIFNPNNYNISTMNEEELESFNEKLDRYEQAELIFYDFLALLFCHFDRKNRGVSSDVGLYIVGPPGVGKSCIFTFLNNYFYGALNSISLNGPSKLCSDFNMDIVTKLSVIIEEDDPGKMNDAKNPSSVLKYLITNKELHATEKNRMPIMIPNHMSIVILQNEYRPFLENGGSRRFLYIEPPFISDKDMGPIEVLGGLTRKEWYDALHASFTPQCATEFYHILSESKREKKYDIKFPIIPKETKSKINRVKMLLNEETFTKDIMDGIFALNREDNGIIKCGISHNKATSDTNSKKSKIGIVSETCNRLWSTKEHLYREYSRYLSQNGDKTSSLTIFINNLPPLWRSYKFKPQTNLKYGEYNIETDKVYSQPINVIAIKIVDINQCKIEFNVTEHINALNNIGKTTDKPIKLSIS